MSSTRPLKVAYLGPKSSFSHQAAVEAFSENESAVLCPLPSFKEIFSAIQEPSSDSSRSFDFAIIPFENSTNGNVLQVLDLLVQSGANSSSCLFPDVEVVAEHYLQVHHCLYIHGSAVPSRSPRNGASVITAATDVPISKLNITTIYSHPQVWGQCNTFLSKSFSPAKTERIDVSSTSAAAVFVANHPPTTSMNDAPDPVSSPPEIPAAICSSLAGQQEDLALVAENIEDEPGKNTTRFLILRHRKHAPPVPVHLRAVEPMISGQPVHYKSLLTFTIPHKTPGSLALALAVFSKYDLNLSSITTRPSRQANWDYVFFVECEEVSSDEGESSPKVQKLLPDLQKVAKRTCWLGTWMNRLIIS